MTNKPRKKNDILLKSAFEEAFPDLLRFFYPQADQVFDLDKEFQVMDKELREIFPEREKRGGTRAVDLLVKVNLLKGGFEYILVHIEIEGGDKTGFEKRMYQYHYRLTDRFDIPVEAIAVFTGDKGQKRPDHYQEKLIYTELLYKYKTYHILDHTHNELMNMDNPFSLIVLAAQKALLERKMPEKELGEERLTIARALIANGKYSHEKIARFIYFLKNIIFIKDKEINRIFDTVVDKLTGRTNAMGIIETINELTREEGFEKGIEKGKQQVVENLIIQFGFSDEQVASVVEMPLSFVKKVRSALNIKR